MSTIGMSQCEESREFTMLPSSNRGSGTRGQDVSLVGVVEGSRRGACSGSGSAKKGVR